MTRTRAARIADTLAAFDRERDCWIAAGRKDGTAHLVPLSFCWDGERLVVATLRQSVTANALKRTGRVRLSLPSTDDVVIIDAIAEIVALAAIDVATHRLFCMVSGFDPSREPEPYVYLLLTPVNIQAWRDVPELADREIMTGGKWLDEDSGGAPSE